MRASPELPQPDRVEGEGRSLYFHDCDNHLFEGHAGILVDGWRGMGGRRE